MHANYYRRLFEDEVPARSVRVEHIKEVDSIMNITDATPGLDVMWKRAGLESLLKLLTCLWLGLKWAALKLLNVSIFAVVAIFSFSLVNRADGFALHSVGLAKEPAEGREEEVLDKCYACAWTAERPAGASHRLGWI